MDEPADRNPPIVGTEIAVRDVSAAVDFILSRRDVPRLALIGWSWGTAIMASFTAQHASTVERLLPYAPSWVWHASPPTPPPRPPAPYRTLTHQTALNPPPPRPPHTPKRA